jgi:hypothetical protein
VDIGRQQVITSCGLLVVLEGFLAPRNWCFLVVKCEALILNYFCQGRKEYQNESLAYEKSQ